MGMPETLPSNKTNKHTGRRLTQKTQKIEHLYEKETRMGKPEMCSRHKKNKHSSYEC